MPNSRGSAFVAFSSADEATRAVTEMNGKMAGTKPLYVALAQRKEDRMGEGQSCGDAWPSNTLQECGALSQARLGLGEPLRRRAVAARRRMLALEGDHRGEREENRCCSTEATELAAISASVARFVLRHELS